mmetsp:Transcript_27852/g.69826  ORF Transcript_27852/g.69826 Transcript_27852/m.69826 type:complete len:215 (+) Transcript_27852:899-1543(+)
MSRGMPCLCSCPSSCRCPTCCPRTTSPTTQTLWQSAQSWRLTSLASWLDFQVMEDALRSTMTLCAPLAVPTEGRVCKTMSAPAPTGGAVCTARSRSASSRVKMADNALPQTHASVHRTYLAIIASCLLTRRAGSCARSAPHRAAGSFGTAGLPIAPASPSKARMAAAAATLPIRRNARSHAQLASCSDADYRNCRSGSGVSQVAPFIIDAYDDV